MRRLAVLAVLAACHHPTPTPPSNTSAPVGWSPRLALRADQVPGWLAVAPLDDGAGAAFIVDHPDAAGRSLLLVPPTGDAQTVSAGDATTVPYGCDENSLAVVPLHGAAPMPSDGIAWALPAQDAWTPAAAALRETAVSRTLHTWTAGPLALSLTRVDDTRATLAIAAGDRVLYRHTDEEVWMDGAEPQPLDLTATFLPAVGVPRAVYLLTPDGPALVVLRTAGFEGETWSALLVGADGAAPVDAMDTYLYSCAF